MAGIDLLIQKLLLRDQLNHNEVAALRALTGRWKRYARRSHMVRLGEHLTHSTLLIEGWAARVKDFPDGRRQITQLHIPGDFVDLHGFLLKRLDHGILAVTECAVIEVPHDQLRALSEREPHLTRLLWLSTLIDAAIHREWLTLMGRGSSLEQIAHLICELYVRLEAVGLARDQNLLVPLTQEELADVCGLTAVHVNRVLQDLRSTGLIATKGRTVTIPDFERLRAVAHFDPTYLNLHNEPR